MRRMPSKSTLPKKQKSTTTVPQSKKNSRVVKANSCVKIVSQATEQQDFTMTSKQLSKPQLYPLSQKLLSKQSNTLHLIDKPAQHNAKQTHRTNRGKSSIQTTVHEQTIEELRRTRAKNQELNRQNITLKERCCQLQDQSTKDKEKIKNLIIRINEVKNSKSNSKTMHPSTAQLPTYQQSSTKSHSVLLPKKLETPYKGVASGSCQNHECIQRKRYLQNELYHQRVLRDRLEGERREWERNRELLKAQYNELLSEIRDIRNDE